MGAERDLEIHLSEKQMQKEREELTEQYKDDRSKRMHEAQKDLIKDYHKKKEDKIKECMERAPEDRAVQDVGRLLL